MEFETPLAIIVHQPMEPLALEISSTTRKTDERRQLGPAHRARQVHLQEAGLGQRLDHGRWHAAQFLAFVARRANLRDQASGRGDDLGFCPLGGSRGRDAMSHDAASRPMSGRALA